MEVLRWSGRPRMALINLIGTGDHVAEWRTALDQFFAIVRVFDAVHADFDKRIELLRAFGDSTRRGRTAAPRGRRADRRTRQRRAPPTRSLHSSACAHDHVPSACARGREGRAAADSPTS
jgi:hypothetical protein